MQAITTKYHGAENISDRLAAAGYSHQRTSHSVTSGKRAIVKTDTGELVGNMTVYEAVEFLESIGA